MRSPVDATSNLPITDNPDHSNAKHLAILQNDFAEIASCLKSEEKFTKIVRQIEQLRAEITEYNNGNLSTCIHFMGALRVRLVKIMQYETNFLKPTSIHNATYAALQKMSHWPNNRIADVQTEDYFQVADKFITANGEVYSTKDKSFILDTDLIVNRDLFEVEKHRWKQQAANISAGLVLATSIYVMVAISPLLGLAVIAASVFVVPLLGKLIGERIASRRAAKIVFQKRPHLAKNMQVMSDELFLPVDYSLQGPFLSYQPMQFDTWGSRIFTPRREQVPQGEVDPSALSSVPESKYDSPRVVGSGVI